MGPPENPTRQFEKQAARGRKPPAGRPRRRLCLLKGCERRFRAAHGRQRYCSSQCRQAARAWSGWKTRLKYRATARGKQKRNRQSQRYRKRVQERKLPRKETAAEPARVIPKKFFRWLLRPARLLRMLHAPAAIAAATILLACLPTRDGARLGTRTALATAAWRAIPFSWKMAPCAAALKAKR